MSELLAQGPEFAGDNVSFKLELSDTELVANALKVFWGARKKGDVSSMHEARKQISAAGGTTLEALQLAQEC